jgi:hypothetical protein
MNFQKEALCGMPVPTTQASAYRATGATARLSVKKALPADRRRLRPGGIQDRAGRYFCVRSPAEITSARRHALTRVPARWMRASLLVVALCVAPVADAARRLVEVGSGRGLDATVVPTLLVDHDGLLWVGSREGLYRYDGYLATAYLPVATERSGSRPTRQASTAWIGGPVASSAIVTTRPTRPR